MWTKLIGLFVPGNLGVIALVIGVVALVSAGGATFVTARYYNSLIVTSSTHAAQVAYTQGQTAQATQDASDYAKAQADLLARQHALQTANDKLAALLAKKHILVPNPTGFKFPAAAMKALNDPDIVGDTP